MPPKKMHAVIVGSGRAGMARKRVLDEDERFEVRIYRWRDMDISDLKDLHADIFFICTANDTHYLICKCLLSMGRDVVVEFPPCASREEWQELTAQAQKTGAHLHCALIGLYTKAHTMRRAWVKGYGATQIRVVFQGGYYRWITEESQKGHALLLAFSRLVCLWDICGSLHIEDLVIEQNTQGYQLKLRALGADGALVYLEEKRSVGMKRSVHWHLESHAGIEWAEPLPKRENLFARDIEYALSRKPPEVSLDAIFRCIDDAQARYVRKE